ncbi:MAG: phosphopantetheine-binding protein [Thermodesulfobacteriota bacterium]|nr:phosphopantetheine-binding protein [Thermodesulfobacteriota bacterium]
METIKNKIKEILVNDLKIQGVQPSDISDTEPLFEDGLGLDSLDAVELVVLIQKHFDVQIADMEEGKKAFASVEALAAYIKEHQAD